MIANDERVVLVDTGFRAETGLRRGRAMLRCPIDSLSLCGFDVRQVRDVILTHLHYDHAGNMGRFDAAHFHLQRREIEFVTSAMMSSTNPNLGGSVEASDIHTLLDLIFAGRVNILDGYATLAPGIELHRIGGHTPGQQLVRVRTARGWVVLANDTCHYEKNLADRHPVSAFVDLREMIAGFDTIMRLADGDMSRIIPGHDPIVMRRFPSPHPSLNDIVVRVDLPPLHIAP
ncbi:N-acyl homoserine lactonase family protein [Gluconacetobacter sacchari]|uniref:N-acyl homoserine lactonase family protein n=1 Tax=Gluconacetobacter sacchari TaxID=92759 RepID=UPI0039B42281